MPAGQASLMCRVTFLMNSPFPALAVRTEHLQSTKESGTDTLFPAHRAGAMPGGEGSRVCSAPAEFALTTVQGVREPLAMLLS